MIGLYLEAPQPSSKDQWIESIDRRIREVERRVLFDCYRVQFGDELDLLIMDIERHTHTSVIGK